MGHLRFGDDEELPDVSTASPSVVEISLPRACDVANVSANRNNPSYVFKNVCREDGVLASTSDNIIKAWSMTEGRLVHLCDYNGHQNNITDISFSETSTFHSCSADHSLVGWDVRTGQPIERFTTNQELYSLSCLEHLLAAGGQGEVVFWDRRNPGKPMAALSDTHMGEVTQVKIHPSKHVISASSDGLVVVHNMAGGVAEEDDNFSAALNIDTSVEEIGLYGIEEERLWVRTGTESFHLWEWRIATLNDKEGGHGAFSEWPEARNTAAAAAAQSSVAPLFEEVGYLIGCHYDKTSQKLMLLAGTMNGSVGFFPIVEQGTPCNAPLSGAVLQPPVMALQGVHTDVVRSVHCFGSNTQAPFCVSGGEDGQVCLWTLNPSLRSNTVVGSGQMQAMGNSSSVLPPPHPNPQHLHGTKDMMDCDGPGPSRRQGNQNWGKQVRMQRPY